MALPTDTVGFRVFGVRLTVTRMIAIFAALGLTAGVLAFLGRTRIGLWMRSVAENRDISSLLGVPIVSVETWAWTISGVLAGFTGVMLATMVRLDPSVLTFLVIPAMSAAVIGRLTSLYATLFGGLAIGVVEAMLTLVPAISPYRSGSPVYHSHSRHCLDAASCSPQRLSDSRSTMFSVTPTAFLAGALLVVALFVIPAVASGFWLTAFTLSVCYTIGLAGLSLVYARLGQVSLVQASLIAVGGWVTLRLSHLGIPFEICVLGGAVATGAVGFLIGLPALRMRGLYLALVTLMAAGGAQILFNRIRFPNGGEGFLGAVRSGGVPMDRSILAVSDPAYFRYTVIVCVLAFVIIELHRRGRPGRAWALIRKSEAAAIASGVNVTLYKTWAFTLSGVLAGLAGGMLAGTLGVLDPINSSSLRSRSCCLRLRWSGVSIPGLVR